jgi:CENP-B N-terminal DNA-binding domain
MKRRLSVIQQVNSGKSENAVAAEFGVSRHQIQGIMKNEKKIIEGVNGQQLKLCSKVLVTTNKYPEVDLAAPTGSSRCETHRVGAGHCRFHVQSYKHGLDLRRRG